MSSMNTMNRFEYADADSVDSAIALLKGKDGAAVKAGGVDLLDLMKEGLATPARLVNIRNIKGLDFIEQDEKGLRIGPLVTMANLAESEPKMLAWWEQFGIYKRLRHANVDRPLWILHDGPPYANGHIHMGTVLNKVLKDIVVKSRTMLGSNAVYVPGFD